MFNQTTFLSMRTSKFILKHQIKHLMCIICLFVVLALALTCFLSLSGNVKEQSMKLLSLFYSGQIYLSAHHVIITISELLRNFPEELERS